MYRLGAVAARRGRIRQATPGADGNIEDIDFVSCVRGVATTKDDQSVSFCVVGAAAVAGPHHSIWNAFGQRVRQNCFQARVGELIPLARLQIVDGAGICSRHPHATEQSSQQGKRPY